MITFILTYKLLGTLTAEDLCGGSQTFDTNGEMRKALFFSSLCGFLFWPYVSVNFLLAVIKQIPDKAI